MRKAVFLDRDGIINKPIIREGKPTSPRLLEEWEWNDGIHDAVRQLKKSGFLILVVTNQPDIVRGLYSKETMEKFHQMINDELNIDDLTACMHDNHDHCHCRKPKPGMLLDHAKKWNISIEKSVFIGDTHKDMGAGKAAGVFSILIDEPYNQESDCDLRVSNLDEAVQYILKNF